MKKVAWALILNFFFCCGSGLAAQKKIIVCNSQLQRVLASVDGRLRTVEVKNKIINRMLATDGPEFVLTYGEGKVLTSDDFLVTALKSSTKSLIATLEAKTQGLQAEITYNAASDQPWLYKQIKFINIGSTPFLLRTVELEHLKIKNEKITYEVDPNFPKLADWGQPVYMESLWLGVEFVATRSSVTADGFIFLRHHPGIELATGQSYLTKKAIMGAAAAGKVKNAFMDYVTTLPPRQKAPQMSLYWNGFRAITPPDRLSKGLAMINCARKLKEETGFTLDAWTYDAGFNTYRPDALFKLKANEEDLWDKTYEKLKPLGIPLGFWCSFPPSYDTYTHEWGKTQGYELQDEHCYCLAGPNYFAAIKKRLENIVRTYQMGSINFDGMYWGRGFGCNEAGHGHMTGTGSEVGVYSLERVIENEMEIFHSLRQINPEIILDLFVCNEWSSPWWLLEVDGVHTVESDTVIAHIPSPWARDELITGRDLQVFKEHRESEYQFPLWAEDLYGTQVRRDYLIDGVIFNGESTAERWEDEYVMALPGRGAIATSVLCCDLDTLDKTKSGLKFLGEVANWTRANQTIYRDFHLIGGEPSKRQTYGYSHCDGQGRTIIALRNPDITTKTFPLKVGESLGFQPSDKKIYVNIVYPYRKTFKPVKFNETVDVQLQDYQVVLLEVRTKSQQFKGIEPGTRWSVNNAGQVQIYDESALDSKIIGKLIPEKQGDKTCLTGNITIPQAASNGQAQVMLDPRQSARISKPVVLVDGQKAKIQYHERSGNIQQNWVLIDLTPGDHKFELVLNGGTAPKIFISVWLIVNYDLKGHETSKKVADYKNLFPVFAANQDRRMKPLLENYEMEISLSPIPGSQTVFLSDMAGRCIEMGVTWAQFSWDRACLPGYPALRIGDKVYEKGVSFHSPGSAKFDIDGKFRRFVVDMGMLDLSYEPKSSQTAVRKAIFIVEADGKELYHSSVLKNGDQPCHIEVDVTGTKMLTIRADKTEDGSWNFPVVWAEARLER
ncbi:MAG: hypothetical protein A2Y12_14825 [Planctomycetes bacterium GWF2_42_9]|nr:MAG: hypothetical protein A2Y12_14825 [Planctomycetes bacterium GWF2_42_9]